MKIQGELEKQTVILVVVLLGITILMSFFASGVPQGPNQIIQISNATKGSTTALTLNISGGYITTVVINATTQNMRWKAVVGNVSGKLTLDDNTGATIYDWSLSFTTGEVYATRNVTTPTWASIKCANITLLERENNLLSQTNPDDNLSKTFTPTGGTHQGFNVGTVPINADSCPTLNTYVNNATQNTYFEEMVLTDLADAQFGNGGSVIFTTRIEQDRGGFDNRTYDFQMLMPENGSSTWSGSTAYYIYAELT